MGSLKNVKRQEEKVINQRKRVIKNSSTKSKKNKKQKKKVVRGQNRKKITYKFKVIPLFSFPLKKDILSKSR